MASKLLIPMLLGAICMLTVVTALGNGNFKGSQVISMPKAKDEKNLVLVAEWFFSYCCPGKDRTCCLPPYAAPDFGIHTVLTINGDGQSETNCNGPLFKKDELTEQQLQYIQVYWASKNCTNDSLKYWKIVWEKYGRCSGLRQKEWFQLAIELFEPEFIVGLFAKGVVPGGKYSPETIKEGLDIAVGHKVGLRCNNNSVTGERQLYRLLVCYSQDDNEIKDCDSHNTPPAGDDECSGPITLPRNPCKPSFASSCGI